MHAKDEELNKIKEIIQKSEWGEKKVSQGKLGALIGKLVTYLWTSRMFVPHS